MTRFGQAAATAAALLTAATPIAASAAPAAARLSLANAVPRAGAHVTKGRSGLFGQSVVVTVLAIAAIAGAVALIVTSDNNKKSVSP